MGYTLETKLNSEQFTSLINAIENGGGGGGGGSNWTKLVERGTHADLTNLQYKELMVVFHVDASYETYNYTITIPKGETGTFVNGFYYSSQYSGSVGCSVSTSSVDLSSSWCKCIYSGSNVGTFKFSVYYR